ncbi:glycoside hydrolase family 3 protein [Vibrio aestuarianus]|uniref:Exo 1,3/1,4-beta-D-glucan glucohydrolase n=1 Tax=Vibrio aestuarianus TaxID=28171 RepID=A0A9X4INY2_9VIBR|nr:glycoside hydrolase family 3 protein [Vibrio aestuarianus]MDE1241272.1 exo 1,3/1,4-beta-D-glucan glucohydrolase [Vibrio aestuarianus]
MTTINKAPYFDTWPKIESAIKSDPAIEQEVAKIVSLMTLEEKIGQMIQPEIRDITAQEIIQYKIGTVLNGGGSWPNNNKHAPASEWVAKADEYWFAAQKAFAGRPFNIPFMWGTDAVHGHNNVYGATVFPHNIGLGCARDTALIRKIGRITAIEIAATGIDWTFAPTVATPRDLRWGRVYEGYSEDPEVTYAYASEMVVGLQGDAVDLQGEHHVISNVKHWVGDGGTINGVDRGTNIYSEDLLCNIHAMGYFSGLNAGAQVVMSSFNTWDNAANYDHSPQTQNDYNFKIHGSKYLLTDVLKEKMGFDGLVVTDWHGHSEISKCTDGNATYAINAGNDILMIPIREHWQSVYHQAVSDAKSGVISMSRIDDAVTRILRVKMRAGLWHKPHPSARALAGNQSLIGSAEHRTIARQAVRQSMVLLKNKGSILPLKRGRKILLTGSGANDLQKQSGGWNLTWQGDENCLADFPGATTVKMALEAELGQQNVCYDPELTSEYQAGDIALVVFGEDPYSEMMGDIKAWQSLEFSTLKRSYRADSEKIKALHQRGVKVVSIFFSGRPLFVNEEIALSEAFVAAFLPGSEGRGITDVLIANADGEANCDFTGTLSFSWPNKKRSACVNRIPRHIPNYVVPECEQSPLGEHAPLFEYGYGLDYSDKKQTRDLDNLDLDIDPTEAKTRATHAEHLYGIMATIGDYQLKVSDADHWMGTDVSRNNVMKLSTLNTRPYNYQQQQDAVEIEMMGGGSMVYAQTGLGQAEDFSHYDNEQGVISFEIKVLKAVSEPMYLAVQRLAVPGLMGDSDNVLKVDVSEHFAMESETFVRVRVPCAHFSQQGLSFSHLDTPFSLFTHGECKFVLANICWDTL